MTATQTVATATPVINFASQPASKLADLLNAFADAERELEIACTSDDKFPYVSKQVKVLGGILPASTIIVEDGRPPARVEVSEWFYRSMDDIDRDYERLAEEAANPEARETLDRRFADLRAECDRQLKAVEKTIPRGKRAAERRLTRAHRAVSAIERKIIEYKPANLAEAGALLEFCSAGKRVCCFSTCEYDLHAIMLNVAEAIRQEIGS